MLEFRVGSWVLVGPRGEGGVGEGAVSKAASEEEEDADVDDEGAELGYEDPEIVEVKALALMCVADPAPCSCWDEEVVLAQYWTDCCKKQAECPQAYHCCNEGSVVYLPLCN